MAISGGGALGVRSMECLSGQCRGTSVGEEKTSLYSSTTLSIYCCHTGETSLEFVATIFFLPFGRIVMKKKFLVWEIILLIFFNTKLQGKKNILATTSKQGSRTRLQQMDKVMEEYEDIFSSPTEVPLHCQVKHSIDLTPGTPPPYVSITHVNT